METEPHGTLHALSDSAEGDTETDRLCEVHRICSAVDRENGSEAYSESTGPAEPLRTSDEWRRWAAEREQQVVVRWSLQNDLVGRPHATPGDPDVMEMA